MKCPTCGIDTGMHALSDKPDPGWGHNSHTWEQCARQLLAEAADLPSRQRGDGDLKERIVRLLAARDGRWDQVNDVILTLQNAVK
jgi:hypothetical protein